MLAEVAETYPVYSFASGPTNSMRGAAFLSKRDEALVVDVGGTTTDIGSLRHGFPREANNVVEIGGVRTLFRMPDLLSLGLGGGTIVSAPGVTRGPALTIGPASVGYRLTEQALVFGGDVLTVTDVAVADNAPFFIGFDRQMIVWPAAGTCEAFNKASLDGIASLARHHDGNSLGRLHGRQDNWVPSCYHDDISLETRQLSHNFRDSTGLTLSIAEFNGDVLSFYITKLVQSVTNLLRTNGLSSGIARR